MSTLRSREEYILHLLEKRHRVSTEELSAVFGLAPSSIRRQLTAMEKRGLLIRCYGGAASLDAGQDEPVERKNAQNPKIKRQIAERARECIRDGETLAFGAGTTVAELCEQLSDLKKSKVYTNSLLAANILKKNPSIELWINSGIVHSQADYIMGPSAVDLFKGLRVDKAFLGCDGFNPEIGAYSSTFANSIVERAICEAAREIYILMDNSKLNRRSTTVLLPVEKIDYVVTDSGCDPDAIRRMEEKGVRVLVAEKPGKQKSTWII